MIEIQKKAKCFFESFIGKPSSEFRILAQSGSARINFFAASEEKKFIITYNENLKENEAFYYFSEVFTQLKLNTPQIFMISEDRKIYIQEFLGECTLSEIIEKNEPAEKILFLVKQSLDRLHNLQNKTISKINYSKTFEYESYDELPITHDLYYFKNFVADILELQYHKSTLLKEFKKLVQNIECLEPKGLMIRDFQARNIMVNENNEVYFIDYQSAMKGPLMYDVVSFLFQAKANFSENFQNEMLEYYYSIWNNKHVEISLRKALKPLQFIRFLQVLGAYGFLGLIQKKIHFINSIEKGIENIYRFSESWEEINEYPEFKGIINQLTSQETQIKINKILHSK